MKALSVVDPAGTRILSGKKTLEIRQWAPGELPLQDLVLVQNSIRLSSKGTSEDPDGLAIAIVDVIEVTEWTEDQLAASCGSYWEPGWLAWHLANVRPISPPVRVPAKLRIYELDLNFPL